MQGEAPVLYDWNLTVLCVTNEKKCLWVFWSSVQMFLLKLKNLILCKSWMSTFRKSGAPAPYPCIALYVCLLSMEEKLACFLNVQNTEHGRGVCVCMCMCVSACVCVCVCGLDWQKGWQWGLHPKKGFLSRWQLQDWQEAILWGNGVSQPVSLPVRQPLSS